MKRAFVLAAFLLAAPWLRGQEPAIGTPSRQESLEDYKILKGNYETLMDAKTAQDRRIQDLEAQIRDLKAQIAAKPSGNFATQEDLKRTSDALKDGIEKVDKARRTDNDNVIQSLNKIEQAVKAQPTTKVKPPKNDDPGPVVKNPPKQPTDTGAGTAANSQDGFQYEVKDGDTLIKITRKLFSEKGVKISSEKIQEANPGVTPTTLKVGQKLFIPTPKTPGNANP